MSDPKQIYWEKKAAVLVKNLKSRHFDAYYCANREAALEQVLKLIPEGATVGWGGAMSAQQVGVMAALAQGARNAVQYDRDLAANMEERVKIMKRCLTADVFLTGANAISLDGQMVNIDGAGNRVAAIVYGPDSVIVVAGMNKVVDTLEDALRRARTVAAPMNKQRFPNEPTPCLTTGSCADCKSEKSICNQMLITRNCRPAGRIKFVLVGEELGL